MNELKSVEEINEAISAVIGELYMGGVPSDRINICISAFSHFLEKLGCSLPSSGLDSVPPKG